MSERIKIYADFYQCRECGRLLKATVSRKEGICGVCYNAVQKEK